MINLISSMFEKFLLKFASLHASIPFIGEEVRRGGAAYKFPSKEVNT